MNGLLGSDNLILMILLLFIFLGGDTFDVTQLLLALALFSTIVDTGHLCPGTPLAAQTIQNTI